MIVDLSKTTKVFSRLCNQKDMRLIVSYGGARSSKTISILQYITAICQLNSGTIVVITKKSLKAIKNSIFSDWKTIVMKDSYDPNKMSDMVYRFENKSEIRFIGADNEERFHGMEMDYIFLDELQFIPKQIFDQAEMRTRKQIICSFNPTSKFWIADYMDREDCYVDHSTYLDNPFLAEPQIKSIEENINKDENLHRVYTLGEWGVAIGLIFNNPLNYTIVDKQPETFKRMIHGLDFGYSNDPCSITDIYLLKLPSYNQGLISDKGQIYVSESLYKTGQLNKDIRPYISSTCVADSAEPKSIAELKSYGCHMIAAEKGPDSINAGINLMKEYDIMIESRSSNIIYEFQNYKWDTDRDGNPKNKPEDDNNHAIDGIRYAVGYLSKQPTIICL